MKTPQHAFKRSFILLSCVYFLWGFLTSFNSLLVPYLQQHFQLSYTQAMLIQLAFYLAPFIACLPTAFLIRRWGYKRTLIRGLLVIFSGCLIFVPATEAFSYAAVLVAIFITALGVASLQVVANPCVVLLGDPKMAASRLTLSSAINSAGTTLAPYIASIALFSVVLSSAEASIQQLQLPYLACAAVTIVIAILISRENIPENTQATETQSEEVTGSLWANRHFVLGVATIFCYVGVEVSIGTFIVGYISDPAVSNAGLESAGKLVAFYWAGSMVFRLLGSQLFRWFNPRHLLIMNAIIAIGLLTTAIMLPGFIGAAALIAIGVCNSIMYPVIFSLALKNLGAHIAKASAILVMAGIGGAAWPMLQAIVADHSGLHLSFIVPMFGYLIITYFGIFGYKPCQWSMANFTLIRKIYMPLKCQVSALIQRQ
ncbi:glucose/galactose MFS transporter [Photobacterium sanctipauli]|uniref:Glucose/galactose MFS transporter n=1 Tax=Photobacterium sanctipauli TaxID=1342794 RepID=A0A2T3NX49_9GAMM|nr:sugar MFS transporter [Photobacterium sanctipauli]PSW20792.1 glucose/galactose MFS transporter [Photobacterium sanctipauli]